MRVNKDFWPHKRCLNQSEVYLQVHITNLRTNLMCRSAFAAACEADKHFKFHVQYSLAVAKAATLAVNCGESALDQNVTLSDGEQCTCASCFFA